MKYQSIYSRRGDEGKTDLNASKERVSKSHPRIVAVGKLDTFNCTLGFLSRDVFGEAIRRIQQDLFLLMGEVACDLEDFSNYQFPRIEARQFDRLTAELDELCKQLDEWSDGQSHWTIYGASGEIPNRFYYASCVCREAEVQVSQLELRNPFILSYLNALSKYLYLMAKAMEEEGGEEKAEKLKR